MAFSLLMFPFTPPLLLLIPSSCPPKHSDASSLRSVLRTRQDLQYPAHRTGWAHPKCVQSSTVPPERLLGLLPVGSSPTHCTVTGPKILEVGGACSLLASSTRHKRKMFMVEPQKNTNTLCLLLWTHWKTDPSLVYPKEQHLLLLYNRDFFPHLLKKIGILDKKSSFPTISAEGDNLLALSSSLPASVLFPQSLQGRLTLINTLFQTKAGMSLLASSPLQS